MKKKLFRIGDFTFSLFYPEGMVFPSDFAIFEVEDGKSEYDYTINITSDFPRPEGQMLAVRDDLLVYGTETVEQRYLRIRGMLGFYACYREKKEASGDIYILQGSYEYLKPNALFVSMFALERRMLEKNSLILHCAYMEYGGKAILFSAPSETGKTTQANLWEKYRGSRTVNGDKALLRKADGVWTACGWPICGSSGVCHNEEYPVEAIVMLSQAKEDRVDKLSPARAFALLYPQITVNYWNKEAVDKTIKQIEKLVQEIPVYHLACNISEDAVKCLENQLFLTKEARSPLK